MHILANQDDLEVALERLVFLDHRLASLRAQCGPIAVRRRPQGLAALLEIVIAQQVSVASARAIWARFEAIFPHCDAGALSRASFEDLQACGLSRPKIRTVQAVASAVQDGLVLERLARLDEADARARLQAIHGIGPWTADIYLLFCLGAGDIFPSGDLALQIGVEVGLGLEARPAARALASLAATHWAPERGAAAHLFWAYYKVTKSGNGGVI